MFIWLTVCMCVCWTAGIASIYFWSKQWPLCFNQGPDEFAILFFDTHQHIWHGCWQRPLPKHTPDLSPFTLSDQLPLPHNYILLMLFSLGRVCLCIHMFLLFDCPSFLSLLFILAFIPPSLLFSFLHAFPYLLTPFLSFCYSSFQTLVSPTLLLPFLSSFFSLYSKLIKFHSNWG